MPARRHRPIPELRDKRDYANIGRIREKEPPFSFIVQIFNQEGQMIPGIIRIKGKYDKDWVIFTGTPSAEYVAHFQMDLSDLSVEVAIRGQVQRFTPPDHNPLCVTFATSIINEDAEVEFHDKAILPQEEGAAEPGNAISGEEFLPEEEHTLNEDHSMPQIETDLARVQVDHSYDVIRRTFAAAESQQVGPFLEEARKLALKMNKVLRQKIKGSPTIQYSPTPRGSLAYNRMIPSLIARNPQFIYRKYPKKVPLHRVLVAIDLSQSTELVTSGKAWGSANFSFKVKDAIIIAAMTLIIAVLERGGQVTAYFFADKDNPNHLTNLVFRRETLQQAAGELFRKEAGGSTRLDELLAQIEDQDLATLSGTIDGMFLLMDGAPMGTSNSFEDDDRVQASTISRLKTLEKSFPCYLLWGKSQANPPDFDEPFFRWCGKELQRTATINVGSFVNFPRYINELWEQPPPRHTVIVLPYNTELRYPFELNQAAIDFARNSFVGPSTDKMVDQIVEWVTHNVLYRLPNVIDQDYETAQEVYKSHHGCCGEVSNLICAFMRAVGIPAGVVDVTYLGRIRLQHACVGYVDRGRAKLVDVCIGSTNVTRRGVAEPMSDERWARLMDYWRTERGSVGDGVEQLLKEASEGGEEEQKAAGTQWAIAIL